MKKLLGVLIVLTCLVPAANAQQVEMIIHLKEGSEVRYNVDEIERIESTVLPSGTTRVVELEEYYFELDRKELLTGNFMRFRRMPDGVYLRTPAGRLSKIAGERPAPPESFTERLLFYLEQSDPTVYELRSTQEQWPNYINTAWSTSGIYAAGDSRLWHFALDNKKNVVGQGPADYGQWVVNHEVNGAGTKVAFVRPYRYDFSGSLLEMDLQTGVVDTIITDSMINSVRYDESTGDLIYYSRGHYINDPQLDDAGYYRFTKSTKESKLLVKHKSQRVYSQESWNGFDITSDGRKLLVPIASKYIPGTAIFVEHDLQTGTVDTLTVDSKNTYHNEVWAQYSHSDSLLLFSLTERWGTGASASVVGIYNRSSKVTTPIVVSPSPLRPFSAPYPRWSPDDQAICYGGSELPENTIDYVGPFLVHIKPLGW